MGDNETLGKSTLRPRDFVDVIRSPWPFRTSTIAIYCSAAMLPTVATEYGRLNDPNFLVAILIGLVSITVNGSALFLVRGWVTRRLAGAGWAVLGVLVSIGAFRGVVTSLVVATTNLESHSYLTTRVGLGAVSSPILLAVVALVVSRVVTSRQQRRSTTRDISAATAVRDRVLGEVSEANERFIGDIDKSLRPAVKSIIDDLVEGHPERGRLFDALNDLAENIVRPLSHSIARSEPQSAPPRGSIERQLFGPGRPTLSDQVNPYFSALGVSLGGFSVMLDGLSMSQAIVASVIAGASTLLLLAGARALLGSRRTTTLNAILIIATLHEVVWIPAQLINDVVIFPDSVVVDYSLLGLIATPLLGLVYQLIVLGSFSSRNQLAHLDISRVTMVLQQSEARRTAWLRQRHVAHTLHSSVQSRIHAQARLVRSGTGALTDGERADTVGTLQSVLSVITEEPPARVDAIRSIEDLAAFWSGMCEISLEAGEGVRDALDADSDASEAVSIVTLEIVSNAIRHGNATAIDIDITRDSDETVRITALNDGAALDPKRTPGLGMAIYDELTADWSVRGADHVTVEAVIAARGNTAGA